LGVVADVPWTEMTRDRLAGEGIAVVDLLVESGIAASKGDARRLIAGGGVYLNGERIESDDQRVPVERAIEGRVLLLRKGKKQNHVVRVG
jgi:tyrosyl-tRNA synthetase